MPTNAMGRDPQRPGNSGGNIGGRGSNADKDRAAFGGMIRGTSDLAGERSRLRALGADTVTPRYGLGQAQLSDFGISGGLMNAFKGLLNGNTYSGRMPQGLVGGFSNDGGGNATPAMAPMTLSQRAGLYGGSSLSAGGMLGAQQPQAAPPPIAAQQINPKSQIGQYLSTPGLMAYGVNMPGYKYY